MPNHNSKHHAIGPNYSARQRLVEQLTEKQAKNYKPSEAGRYWLRVDAKTEILVKIGTDEEAKIREWGERALSEYSKFNKNV